MANRDRIRNPVGNGCGDGPRMRMQLPLRRADSGADAASYSAADSVAAAVRFVLPTMVREL